jgi:membrane protein insertase Oxa1/YidC/SpoIIIJ
MAGIFSLVTVFLIPNAPAGIAVYFIASGVWQMGQQGVIHLVWPLPAVPTPEEVKAAKPPPPPPRKRKRRK